MRSRSAVFSLTLCVATVVAVVLPGAALAHKALNVPGYHVEVGWSQEPAFAGQLNSVQVLASTAGGTPVVQFAGALKVKVTHAGATMTFPMEPYKPGDLRAWLIPTAAGRYTFHLTGKIGNRAVDVSATSGPGSFDDVAEAPTVPRAETAASGTGGAAAGQTGIAPAASGGTSTGTVLGIAALVLAALALGIGVFAVARIRKTA